jgi:hypothetical protein
MLCCDTAGVRRNPFIELCCCAPTLRTRHNSKRLALKPSIVVLLTSEPWGLSLSCPICTQATTRRLHRGYKNERVKWGYS